MAKIPIWPGSSSFAEGKTPFGLYDSDTAFATDAPLVAKWCAQRLGYPLIDIELQEINFFTAFEEAVSEYGHQIYTFQIKDNLARLRGSVTASSDGSWTDINQVNITQDYGSLFESTGLSGGSGDDTGGSYQSATTRTLSASLAVKAGRQKYDLLNSQSVNVTWESGSSQINSGSLNIKIKKIYHYAPAAINRYFDPYAGTGTGIQSLMQTFGMGNYSPGVNFMLMPMYFDILKIQAIELNDQIRKSAYQFEITDHRYLRLFPIPLYDYEVWYEYVIKSDALDVVKGVGISGGVGNQITNMSNVPYKNPEYKFINDPGKQWIRKYTLALAKEMLGSVRGKYQSMPIPGAETTLDYARLISEAKDEKAALIEELKKMLEETSRLKQLERQNNEAQEIQSSFGKVPYPIYVY